MKKTEIEESFQNLKKETFEILLKRQNYKCYLTGRELTPENVNGAHVLPLIKGGKHSIENCCLVVSEVKHLKRYETTKDLVELAADIIKTHGKTLGYSIKRQKP